MRTADRIPGQLTNLPASELTTAERAACARRAGATVPPATVTRPMPAPATPPKSLWLDQYGNRYRAGTAKELREQVGGGSVSIMYRDQPSGPPVRVGYVVGHHWCTEYAPVIRPASAPRRVVDRAEVHEAICRLLDAAHTGSELLDGCPDDDVAEKASTELSRAAARVNKLLNGGVL